MSGSVLFSTIVRTLPLDELLSMRDDLVAEIESRNSVSSRSVSVCGSHACSCKFHLPFGLTTGDVPPDQIDTDALAIAVHSLDRDTFWKDHQKSILSSLDSTVDVAGIKVNAKVGMAFLHFDKHADAAHAQRNLVSQGYKVNFCCRKDTMEHFKMARESHQNMETDV